MVPAKTLSLKPLETGIDSPVILASFAVPEPNITSPSTGIFPPVFTKRISSSLTSSTDTSSKSPLCSLRKVVSGTISTRFLIAERVLANVLCSKYAPNKKRKATIADSSNSLITNAPKIARVTKRSMLITLTLRA